MEPIYYMEYQESKKSLEEMYDAYYKYSNHKRHGIFKIMDTDLKIKDKTEKRFEEIRRLSKHDRTVTTAFYDDGFTCATGDIAKEYSYSEVEALFETGQCLVIIADKRRRRKESFLALKKGALRGKSLHDLKAFLLKKCPAVSEIKPL